MTTRFAVILTLALASGTARADAPLDAFLEQRVAEELAADGTILSSYGVALDVELVGDKAIVSLVVPTTGRALASTKLDALPTDREAAVASVTQVAANLVAELRVPSGGIQDALADDRAQRERKEQLEARYHQESIRFGHVAIANSEGTPAGIGSIPFMGDRRLEPVAFLQAVERPDLVARYQRKRSIGRGILIVSGISLAAGGIAVLMAARYDHNCTGLQANFECRADEQAARERRFAIGGALTISGTIGTIVGAVYLQRAYPISERESHELADQYNARLRKKLEVAPYVGPSGGGVTLGGSF